MSESCQKTNIPPLPPKKTTKKVPVSEIHFTLTAMPVAADVRCLINASRVVGGLLESCQNPLGCLALEGGGGVHTDWCIKPEYDNHYMSP